jgi:hypothetical protein
MDRMTEAQARREQVEGREQQRDHERGGRSIRQEWGPG